MGRPARLPGFAYKGHCAYFVTTCTDRRGRFFVSPAIVDMTLQHFLQSAEHAHVEISAYCFMPDHLHLLITVETPDGDLDAFMRRAKQASGFAFTQSMGVKLWQSGYHERVLRSDEQCAKLVARAEDWPLWGSARYTREEILDAVACRRG